jgi:hypothetical protein
MWIFKPVQVKGHDLLWGTVPYLTQNGEWNLWMTSGYPVSRPRVIGRDFEAVTLDLRYKMLFLLDQF